MRSEDLSFGVLKLFNSFFSDDFYCLNIRLIYCRKNKRFFHSPYFSRASGFQNMALRKLGKSKSV